MKKLFGRIAVARGFTPEQQLQQILRLRRLVLLSAVAIAAWCSLSACAGSREAGVSAELNAIASRSGPSIAAAVGYGRFVAAQHAHPDVAASWLAAAWEHGPALHDDRVLRHALGALDTARVPSAARAGHHIERSVAALMEGDLPRAHAALSLADKEAVRSPLDAARIALMRATLAADRDGAAARQSLTTLLRRGRSVAPGALGVALSHRARLLLAGLEQQDRNYKEAIAAFLQLGPASGHFRQARLGLAWCQLLGGNSERVIQVLALLPGGLTGDPERALLAAMAAHQIGRADAARAVIREARGRAGSWQAEEATAEAVLAAIRPGAGEVPLNAPEDGVVSTIADTGATRRLAAELTAARQSLAVVGDEARAWLTAVEAAFQDHVATERSRHTERVSRALADLDVLEPQLPAAE